MTIDEYIESIPEAEAISRTEAEKLCDEVRYAREVLATLVAQYKRRAEIGLYRLQNDKPYQAAMAYLKGAAHE